MPCWHRLASTGSLQIFDKQHIVKVSEPQGPRNPETEDKTIQCLHPYVVDPASNFPGELMFSNRLEPQLLKRHRVLSGDGIYPN